MMTESLLKGSIYLMMHIFNGSAGWLRRSMVRVVGFSLPKRHWVSPLSSVTLHQGRCLG